MKKNMFDVFLTICILLVIILVVFSIVGRLCFKETNTTINSENSSVSNLDSQKDNKQDKPNIPDTKISLTAIGDIMCHNSQFMDSNKNGVYDFSYVFDDIKEHIEKADISIGNLETTFCGPKKGYSGYPQFNTPEALAYDLKELGIDVLTTANNHSLDTGFGGIQNTLYFLDDAGIPHTGTFDTEEKQNTILYQEVNGIKIAILAYTYGTNGIPIPKGKEFCINLIDKDFMLSQINKAKEGNPDVILVSMHWGIEYQRAPNDEQKDLADFLFQNGVDIILGSHPHVLQPFEKREITLEDGTKKDGFVIYSLGNFMAAQNQANTRNSIILNLGITKHGDTGKISIDDISYIPIYMYSYPTYKNYKVLDIRKTLDTYDKGESPLPNNPSLILKSELKSVTDLLEPNT